MLIGTSPKIQNDKFILNFKDKLSIPNNWKGNLVFESIQNNFSLKFSLKIINENKYINKLYCFWENKNEKKIKLIWGNFNEFLPVELPGSFLILIINNGYKLYKWKIPNNGFIILEDYKHLNESSLIILIPNECFNINLNCNSLFTNQIIDIYNFNYLYLIILIVIILLFLIFYLFKIFKNNNNNLPKIRIKKDNFSDSL